MLFISFFVYINYIYIFIDADITSNKGFLFAENSLENSKAISVCVQTTIWQRLDFPSHLLRHAINILTIHLNVYTQEIPHR